MTFPMPYIPAMSSSGYTCEIVDSVGLSAVHGDQYYPTGISAGDLLIGIALSGTGQTFNGRGFTLLKSAVNTGFGILCAKIANGTETGPIGKFTNSYVYTSGCIAFRFQAPLVGFSVPSGGASGSASASGTGTTGTISLPGTTKGTQPKIVIASFASSSVQPGDATPSVTFSGSGFVSTAMSFSDSVKARSLAFFPGDTDQDVTAKTTNAAAYVGMVVGAIIDLEF